LDEFISKNASAVFGLLGALGGGAITFFTNWLVKKREYDLRLWDKILERRIKAHENILVLSLEMRVMLSLGGVEDNGEIARAPQILSSKDDFERWIIRFTNLSRDGSTWLTLETKRELNLVQDYLVTLHHSLIDVPSDKYVMVGQFIRQDFIDLSSELERKAFNFFGKEIRQLKISDLNQWHKYERDHTEQRLRQTLLLSGTEQIRKMVFR
jgi:hypothetical protein